MIKVDAAAFVRLLTNLPSEAGSGNGRLLAMFPTTDVHVQPSQEPSSDEFPDAIVEIILPIKSKRRGNEMRLVIDGESGTEGVDPALVAMVAKAQVYLAKMIEYPDLDSTGVANLFGIDRADVGRVLPLAFMAPRLLDQILMGRQSNKVSARNLARQDLPILWSEQIATHSRFNASKF